MIYNFLPNSLTLKPSISRCWRLGKLVRVESGINQIFYEKKYTKSSYKVNSEAFYSANHAIARRIKRVAWNRVLCFQAVTATLPRRIVNWPIKLSKKNLSSSFSLHITLIVAHNLLVAGARIVEGQSNPSTESWMKKKNKITASVAESAVIVIVGSIKVSFELVFFHFQLQLKIPKTMNRWIGGRWLVRELLIWNWIYEINNFLIIKINNNW